MINLNLPLSEIIKVGSKGVARKTYNQLIEATSVLKIENSLFTDDEVLGKLDFIIEACVYRICELMEWDTEVDYFTVYDALLDELTFDELFGNIGEGVDE